MRNRILLSLFLVLTAYTAQAVPGTFTWTGGGGDGLWTNPDNWAGVPSATFEPSGIPNAQDHDVVIGAAAGLIQIRTQDTVSVRHIDQDGFILSVSGRLKVYGNYNLNFPTASTGTGTLALSGNTLTGTGTLFGTEVQAGATIYLADKTFVGIVQTTPSATSATLLLQGGLNPGAIPAGSAFLYRNPGFLASGSTMSTNVGGQLGNVVTGSGFSAAMRGRVVRQGSNIIGVVMSFESATRMRLSNQPSQTITNQAFELSQAITASGTGSLVAQPGSRISFLGNVNQNIPTGTYANLYIEDNARVSGYTDIFKGPVTTGSDITVSGELRTKANSRINALTGARIVLNAGATHTTWVGDNQTLTAWPLGTFATTESNPFSLVYSGNVNRSILLYAGGSTYSPVEFSNPTLLQNLTIMGSANASTWQVPSKTVMVINGNLALGTLTAYPSNSTGLGGPRLVLGNTTTSSAEAVDFSLYGSYTKIVSATMFRGNSNRMRLKLRGTGPLLQDLFDDFAVAGGALTELNCNRPGMANSYAGNADTYDMTSGQMTITGATRTCDFIAMRAGGAQPPVFNIGSTALTINFGYAQETGTVASTLAGNTITNTGTWLQNGGTFNGGTGSVVFSGFSAQGITVGATAVCNMNRLVMQKTFGAVTVSTGTVNILSEISLASGNNGNLVTTAGGGLVLKSSATGTARVSQIFGGSITGTNITVERYVPVLAGSSLFWMQIGSPVSGQTVASFTEFNPRTTPLERVNVYTYNEQDTTSVFDSGHRYGGKGWKPLASTSYAVPVGKGFRAWFNQTQASGDRTYALKGGIGQGNVDVALTRTTAAPGGYQGGGWNLIANPYPCDIDFTSASLVKPAGLNNAFWVWNGRQHKYQVFVGSGGSDLGTVALNVSGNGGANLISAGQAFWVRLTTGSTANFGFREGAKSNGATFYRQGDGSDPIGAPAGFLKLTLSDTASHTDEAALRFHPATTMGLDRNADAEKIEGSIGLDLAIVPIGDLSLSVHTQPRPTSAQVLPLSVKAPSPGQYHLSFTGLPEGIRFFLLDHASNHRIPVGEGAVLPFRLSQNDLANPTARFALVLEPDAVTGLHEALPTFTLYPNPASQSVQVLGIQGHATLTLRDVAGKVVRIEALTGNRISVQDLKAGVYSVEVEAAGMKRTQRLVVQ